MRSIYPRANKGRRKGYILHPPAVKIDCNHIVKKGRLSPTFFLLVDGDFGRGWTLFCDPSSRGLGHSSMPIRWREVLVKGRFENGGRRCFIWKKVCFWNTSMVRHKTMFAWKAFLLSSWEQMWFLFRQTFGRAWCDRYHVWKVIWLVTFLFAGVRRLWVYRKVKPGQQLVLQLSRSYSDCISQLT